MAFFIFFVLFVFPFLQAGPLDNWASFLAWAIFIIIPLPSLSCSASQPRTKMTTTARKIEPEFSSERRRFR